MRENFKLSLSEDALAGVLGLSILLLRILDDFLNIDNDFFDDMVAGVRFVLLGFI